MNYFTSDLHLGHENILRSRGQFQSIEEMDEYIISRYNARVNRDDNVYIVGDFSFRAGSEKVEYYLKRLRGKKHLIIGNHDIDWIRKAPGLLDQYFESYSELMRIKMNKKVITLCHYPLLEWPGSRYEENGYCVHGHIHDQKNQIYDIIQKYLPGCFNCGVDVNGFQPVTLTELVQNNDIWYERNGE